MTPPRVTPLLPDRMYYTLVGLVGALLVGCVAVAALVIRAIAVRDLTAALWAAGAYLVLAVVYAATDAHTDRCERWLDEAEQPTPEPRCRWEDAPATAHCWNIGACGCQVMPTRN